MKTEEAREIMDVPENIYRGCGKYWVAIYNDTIVAAIPMNGYPEPTLADIGRKRFSVSAKRELDVESDKRFTAYRLESRKVLEKAGLVVSGTMSCCKFIPNVNSF